MSDGSWYLNRPGLGVSPRLPDQREMAGIRLYGHDGVVSRQRVLVLLAFGVMAMTAGGALAALGPNDAGIPLASLPQGGSSHEVDGRQVILVRDGDAVRGFLRLSPRGYG